MNEDGPFASGRIQESRKFVLNSATLAKVPSRSDSVHNVSGSVDL
jgi:hypothetical protein